MLRWNNLRGFIRFSQCTYATANTSTKDVKVNDNSQTNKNKLQTHTVSSAKQSQLIAAAFASLTEISSKSKNSQISLIDEKLKLATDVDTLLSIADQPVIAKRHALKV